MTAVSSAETPSGNPGSPTIVDGRRARRDRNREKVVDALLDLYREGELAPPISRVADRSGMSHRSVFRYFEDLDQLCRVAIERHAASVAHLVEVDRAGRGTLSERIEALVRCRIELYEAVAPVARVTRMRAPLQPVLQERQAADRYRLDRQVSEQFAPELDRLHDSERQAVEHSLQTLCSFDSIELMRRSQGLSQAEVISVLTLVFSRLLDLEGGER